MREVKEYCDCCREEIKLHIDGTVAYKNKVKRFNKPFWPIGAKVEEEWELICESCWRAIGKAVREAKEAA